MENTYVILELGKGFAAPGGRFTREYPDAFVFRTVTGAKAVRDTCAALKDAAIIRNYGTEDQKIVA